VNPEPTPLPVVNIDDLPKIVAETYGVLDCVNGPIQLLSFEQVDDIINQLARLGISLRAKHDTLEHPTHAFVAGPNRYFLDRDGELVHASEFALGDVYLDPTGPLARRVPKGHHDYVNRGLTAILATPSAIPLDIAEIGGRWAVSPFRAATPEQARWLGTDVRPFTEALALHTELPITKPDGHAIGGPVVIARHDTPPQHWPTLAWHPRGKPTSVLHDAHKQRGTPTAPDMFIPSTFNDIFDRWRTRRPKGVRRGYAGIVPPPAARALARVVLIGREGDQLLERQRGITTTSDTVTVYDNGDVDPVWERIPEILRLLGPEQVARWFPNIAERTRRYHRAGRPARPSERVQMIEQLRVEAIRELAHARRAIPDDLPALFAAYTQLLDYQTSRRCEVDARPLTRRQQRFCSDRCRQKARRQRASDLASLYEQITTLIDHIGWRRAQPTIRGAVGHARGGPRGKWRRELNADNASVLVAQLKAHTAQGTLFHIKDQDVQRNERVQSPSSIGMFNE
jgi:hypothetical protein